MLTVHVPGARSDRTYVPPSPEDVVVVERTLSPSVAWTVMPASGVPSSVTRPVTRPNALAIVTVGGVSSPTRTGTLTETYPGGVQVSVISWHWGSPEST